MGKLNSVAAAPLELEARRSPIQERAKETVQNILDATAELLDEEGHWNLTTDRVAQRSGINIATLYHYFPNKLALLHALARQFADRQQEQIDAVFASRAEVDWRDVSDNIVDTILEFNRTVTGAVALSLAMRSYPELRQIDYDRDKRESVFAGSVLAEMGIQGSPSELQFKALVLTQTMGAMVDNALQLYPEQADAAIEEVKLMVKLYVEHYLKQPAEDSSPVDAAD